MRTIPLIFLATLIASGCTTYRHERPTATGIEITSFRSFLMVGKANKVRSVVKDEGYSRTVNVGALEGQGDSGMVTASGEALGEMIGTAARNSIKP